MPIANKIILLSILFVASLSFEAVFPSETQAQQLPPQDVVVLIDSSESVEPYISGIISILNRFVGGSRIGDSFTCFEFSNKPVLIARKKIEKPGDVAMLRSQLRQLRARGKLTNYSPAIRRALDEIRVSLSARPEAERLLILITDGRQSPGDTKSEHIPFKALLKKHSNLKAAEDYSFYSFYIGNWFEQDLQSYLLSAGAFLANWPEDAEWLENHTIADVRILERTAFLGTFPDVPTQDHFSIAMYPRRPPGGVTMIEVDTRTDFAEKSLDKYFTISPRRFLCRDEPWGEQFGLEARGFAKGSYAGTFNFRPSQPGSMLLYPRTVDFSFAVAGGLQVNVPAALNFGPTELRGTYSETKRISVTPGRAGMPDGPGAVSVFADIDLPEGIELSLFKNTEAEEIVFEVTISRNGRIDKSVAGSYEGTITLNSQDGWALNYNEIPISIDVSSSGSFLGTALLYALGAAAVAVAIGALLLVFGGARKRVMDYLGGQTRPAGKLVITYDPTKGTASSINLDRISQQLNIKELVIGIGPEAHVELSHMSMIDRLYTFSARKEKGEIHTFVTAGAKSDETIINEMSRTGEVRLRHFDRVKLGAFEFRYEVPKLLSQVVLYYLDGKVSQGWLLSWNTSAEGFHFQPRGDQEKESYVRFYELKTVAFVRDFDGELTARLLSAKAPRSGHRVKIFFGDQEELTGYVVDWRRPGEKFYLFPDSMGDNVLFFLIEESSIANLTMVEEDEKGAAKADRELSALLGEMKTVVKR